MGLGGTRNTVRHCGSRLGVVWASLFVQLDPLSLCVVGVVPVSPGPRTFDREPRCMRGRGRRLLTPARMLGRDGPRIEQSRRDTTWQPPVLGCRRVVRVLREGGSRAVIGWPLRDQQDRQQPRAWRLLGPATGFRARSETLNETLGRSMRCVRSIRGEPARRMLL
jgi:hypothetical protein